MAIERVASLYFYMRFRESTNSQRSDVQYKGMMQLWVAMAADLRKTRDSSASEQTIRADVATTFTKAISKSLNELEPDVAKVVRRRLTEALQGA